MNHSVKKSLGSTTGLLVRAVIQTGLFFIIAKNLPPDDYGALAAVTAISLITGQFSCLGYDYILVREATLNKTSLSALSIKIFKLFALLLLPLAVISALISNLVLNEYLSITIVFLIIVAEIISAKISHIAICIATAEDNLKKINFYRVLIPGLRLFVVIIALLASTDINLTFWATTLITTSFLGNVIVLYNYRKLLTEEDQKDNHKPLWHAITYAIGNMATRLKTDIDKILLSRLVSLEVTGNISVAHRILDLVNMPNQGFITSHYPNIYKSTENPDNIFQTMLLMLKIPIGYSLIAGIMVLICGEFLINFLLPDYEEAGDIVRWLALYPIINLFRNYFNTILIGLSKAEDYLKVNIKLALFSIVANATLIYFFSWKGAVMALYFSELLFCLLVFKRIKNVNQDNQHKNR